jgi:anti-sigma regulatory factor (Ser/Thr protein kinase)
VISIRPTGSAAAADEREEAGAMPPADSTSGGAAAHGEPAPDARRSEWRFPADRSSVTSMRWELRSLLGDTELSLNEVEDLVLAVSEAANNAVEHAQDPTEPFFDVSTEIDGCAVTVVVQDHGQWRRATPDPQRGRGLGMMRALADTSVTARPNGTTVTIRNHRPAGDEPPAEAGQAS